MDAFMSYVLVLLVLAIQGVLLFCVYEKVIVRNANWHDGIMNTGQSWNIIQPETLSGCNDGQSLCTMHNGTFTCAPPTVQLIGRWDELDTDKDGTWTKAEATESREALRCKYAVDPTELFDVLVVLLKERKEHIWLHPDLKSGKSIPKAYFTYIMGDVAMCGYRNKDMCGNLVKRGLFDAPLKQGNVPRLGTSISSALEYCHSLLDQGGLCERVLPSTYSTWKIESVQECLEPRYEKFVHTDPANGRVKSLLEVDYKARLNYEMAKTPVFKAYKICILFMWMLLIISQIRDVGKAMAWVSQLPWRSKAQEAAAERAHESPRMHAINSMSIQHRVALCVCTVVRLVMLFVLMYVGVNFLGRQTDYIGLLLDGVALLFIVQVEEILYARVLRQDVRTTWEECEPVEIKKVGARWLTSRPDIGDMMWLCIVSIMSVAFLMYYTSTLVEPLYEALECTCLSQGETCREAQAFGVKFWDQYWMKDVPSSIQGINDLKGDYFSVPRKALNLLKYHHSHHLSSNLFQAGRQ